MRLGLINPGDWLDGLERRGFESPTYYQFYCDEKGEYANKGYQSLMCLYLCGIYNRHVITEFLAHFIKYLNIHISDGHA